MVQLIGLNGNMGVGKSEAIKTLSEVAGREVVLVKFAQPLYDMQEFIYGRVSSVFTRPDTFIKDRKLLQWLGTDWGRETISKNVWVDIWKAEVNKNLAAGKLVVCDDVRFDNEAEVIKSLNGKIVRIVSDRANERIDTAAGIKNHASEAGIKHEFVDIILENNGTLEEYKNSLTYLYKKLLVVSEATAVEFV